MPTISGTTARTRSQSRRNVARLRELNNVMGSALIDDIIRMPIATVNRIDDATSTQVGGYSCRPLRMMFSAVTTTQPAHHHRHSRGGP